MSRPARSVTPPAANGMMIFTGLLGYCCADAGQASVNATSTMKARMMRVMASS
jgi:hypothetical protein